MSIALALAIGLLTSSVQDGRAAKSDVPDGVPANVDVSGDDPSNGGLHILIESKLLSSTSKDITLNVDGPEAMRVSVNIRKKRELFVTYFWEGKKFSEQRFTCNLSNFDAVKICSEKVFSSSSKAARYLKQTYR
jgi:hypothetical protein